MSTLTIQEFTLNSLSHPSSRLAESLILANKEKELFRPDDYLKVMRVDTWLAVDNPVIGTCRNCGARDHIDDPVIGLYPEGLKSRATTTSLYYDQPSTPSIRDYMPIPKSEDYTKLSKVRSWMNIDNPVYGTCRHCGHRGLVDSPSIGLY
ncbi:MAG: hypothetical protein V1743_02290 [Nanoarchaeota archaeon]